MDPRRLLRGQQIAETPGAVQHSPKGVGWFRVRSSSSSRWYQVNVTSQTCTCPDDMQKCKHLYAAEIFAEAVRRPDVVVHSPTFADIRQEMTDLVENAEAALANAQAINDNWRCHEEIGADIAALQDEWNALQARMTDFQSVADGGRWGEGLMHALEIIARRYCPRSMMHTVAQMALDGCTIDQINEYLTGPAD